MDAINNPKKMRVLCVSRTYHQKGGGMEAMNKGLVDHLKALPDIDLKLIAYRGSRFLLPLFLITALLATIRASKKADVILLGDPLLAWLGWIAKEVSAKPIVVTVHGLDITYHSRLYRRYLEWFFPNFDAYLPISQYVEKVLTNHFPVRNKSLVIHPGLADTFYDPKQTSQSLAKLLKRSISNKSILLTVGRLVKRKGHAWFIKNVLPKLPDSVLYVMAGTGPEQKRISKLIQRRQLNHRVVMLGYVTNKQLSVLYNKADIFIQPNINVRDDIEGFGLVLLEAGLCQRVVVAAQTEGMTDVIQSGKNGFLVPSGDAQAWIATLRDIIQHPAQYKPVSAQARLYILQTFSWTKATTAYFRVFQKLTNPHFEFDSRSPQHYRSP